MIQAALENLTHLRFLVLPQPSHFGGRMNPQLTIDIAREAGTQAATACLAKAQRAFGGALQTVATKTLFNGQLVT